jgi:Collagen triple helix repeat (20 copies)
MKATLIVLLAGAIACAKSSTGPQGLQGSKGDPGQQVPSGQVGPGGPQGAQGRAGPTGSHVLRLAVGFLHCNRGQLP